MSLFDNHAGLVTRLTAGRTSLTTQTFIEAHVKNGVLFQTAHHPADIAAGANLDYIFTTPADKVLIVKARNIQTDASIMTVNLYDTPTYTGGTTNPAYNLNLNSAIQPGMIMKVGATVSAIGTVVGAPNYFLGSSTQGTSQRSPISPLPGFERILKPNTTYLLRINNGSSFTARCAIDIVWFEGALADYPTV